MDLQRLKIIAAGLALLFACMGCAFYVGPPGDYPYYRRHHDYFEFEWHSSLQQSHQSVYRFATGDMWSRRG